MTGRGGKRAVARAGKNRHAGRTVTFAESTICKGSWQQQHMPMPLRGVLSAPFRAVVIRPSRMNPNICTICELAFGPSHRDITAIGAVVITGLDAA